MITKQASRILLPRFQDQTVTTQKTVPEQALAPKPLVKHSLFNCHGSSYCLSIISQSAYRLANKDAYFTPGSASLHRPFHTSEYHLRP